MNKRYELGITIQDCFYYFFEPIKDVRNLLLLRNVFDAELLKSQFTESTYKSNVVQK